MDQSVLGVCATCPGKGIERTVEVIHKRVICLTGWLLDCLPALRHSNGRPMVGLQGPRTADRRGGTIAFRVFDPDGAVVSERRVEELAAQANISLRTGCFCNPGAGEAAHGVTAAEMRAVFEAGVPLSFAGLQHRMQEHGKAIGAIRISVGLASNFADVYRFMHFVAGLRDKTAGEIGPPQRMAERDLARPDTA